MKPLIFIAGPCVLESVEIALPIAEYLQKESEKAGVDFIFKASYDKANRTDHASFRGPGMVEGLEIFGEIKRQLGVQILTDVHSVRQVHNLVIQDVVDVIQIPALLCRQTDLIQAAAATGKTLNLKKGQFMSGLDMHHAVRKAKEVNGRATPIMITERGNCFGYNDLVVDFRNFAQFPPSCTTIFDMTHSVQRPGAGGTVSEGDRDLAPMLMRAAMATGRVDGLFMEVYPDPDNAKCDGPNSIKLTNIPKLLQQAIAIREVANAV